MTYQLPYPFDALLMKQNKIFLLFCPPDCLDEEQRPVLEGRSMRHPLPQGAFEACPYADSRSMSQKRMNTESLKSLSRHKEEVSSFIYNIGSTLKKETFQGSTQYDLAQLYALSYIGYKSPSLHFCNELLGSGYQVPTVHAIASRFFHGLVNMLDLLMLESGGSLAGVYMTPQELYEYADSHGHLLGLKEACAASPATIIKFLELCQDALQSSTHQATSTLHTIPSIYQLACIILELEFTSLVYETVRCRLWKLTHSNGSASLTQLFAIPHCRIAKRLASSDHPFEHVLFHRALHQWRLLDSCSAPAQAMRQTAIECLIEVAQCAMDHETVHRRMRESFIEVLSFHANQIDDLIPGGALLSMNLDTFFGRWPA
ncbi:hypothetical protein [Pseudomonas sp. COR18]|uniref:hypothetical protein n=1 Tax=Pseudomonas sp. COR18 TaxID=3399680 RepID=UPI003B00C8A2